jgi:Zn-dependent M28 family amino/carboxypeptidase
MGIVAQRRVWRFLLLLGGVPIFLVMVLFYMTRMPGSSYSGPLPTLEKEEKEVKERLEKHVGVLAGSIGERNFWRYEQLQAAAHYIEETFQEASYTVTHHEFLVEGKVVKNIEVEITGHSLPEEIVVIGAHYDSVPGSPGANDNATGTAAVLELARLLVNRRLARTVRFVAFANEEAPFFQSAQMGSRVYARRTRERGEKIVAMLSIETIGYYSDEEGSQQYPSPFGLFYPDTANFIGFIANLSSRELVRRSIASFRRHTAFPSEGVAAPGWVMGIAWSDHWAFWEEGYKAMMVTDTALFRYRAYHTSEDTPDKIDYDRTARVVAGTARVVTELAGPDTDEDIRDG